MQITAKYTVALQLLTTCYLYPDAKITSNYLASKIGSDAVIIRQVMLDLKKAGYIICKPGPGGTSLAIDLDTITLYDVYTLVADPEESLLKFYKPSNSAGIIETNFQNIMNNYFESIKSTFFNEMKSVTLLQLCNQITS